MLKGKANGLRNDIAKPSYQPTRCKQPNSQEFHFSDTYGNRIDGRSLNPYVWI